MQNNILPSDCKKSGIYIITNTVNKKVYIGLAVSLKRRYDSHRAALINQRHSNALLQRFCKKYGIDALSFSVLETCQKEDLASREVYYITLHNAIKKGFNICAGGSLGSTGRVFSKKSRDKMSKKALMRSHVTAAANAARVWSEESRKKASITASKRKASEETRRKIGAASKGHVKSEQTLAKMRAINTGKVMSEESRRKMSLAQKGKKQSPEHIAKVSAALKGKKRSPEQIAKTVARRAGYKHSVETKQKISLAKKGKKKQKEESAETRAKLSAAFRGRVFGEATIKKMSDARKAIWAKRNSDE